MGLCPALVACSADVKGASCASDGFVHKGRRAVIGHGTREGGVCGGIGGGFGVVVVVVSG